MQWLIIASDGQDEGASNRRLAVREEHLAGARELKSNGNFVIGGAQLDDNGQMIGSMMVVEFDTVEEFQAWLEREPYIHKGVWESVIVTPFRVADV